jgi:hypothetical protein
LNIIKNKFLKNLSLILPVIGLLHAKHFLAKRRAKQSAQKGVSSRDVNR